MFKFPKKKAEKKQPQTLKEKILANVKEFGSVVIVVLLIKTFIFEIYAIPTGSMESSLMAGDRIVALRPIYGSRLPQTVLQFPFTHQKFWYTNVNSYVDWIQLPYTKLPGIRGVERHESVIFNYPGDNEADYAHPSDMRIYYIKRCVAVAGDRLEIKDGHAYVNGELEPNPEGKQFAYALYSKTPLSESSFESNDLMVRKIFGTDKPDVQITGQGKPVYLIDEDDPNTVKSLQKAPQIDSVVSLKYDQGQYAGDLFPLNDRLHGTWNRDWMGPFTLPKKGMTVEMTPENISLYGKVIRLYEHNENVAISPDFTSLSIAGQPIDSYTFKQDYYFMMGDNRHNSQDSRYWGFVPQDHIVARPVMVVFSKDAAKGWLGGYRWGRMFSLID